MKIFFGYGTLRNIGKNILRSDTFQMKPKKKNQCIHIGATMTQTDRHTHIAVKLITPIFFNAGVKKMETMNGAISAFFARRRDAESNAFHRYVFMFI